MARAVRMFTGVTLTLLLPLCVVLSSLTVAVTSSGFDDVSTAECNVAKNCFRRPDGCLAANCESLLTWKRSEPGYVDFEMMAVTSGWVAFGLSFDRSMGNDSVTVCSVINAPFATRVNMAFNPATYNPTTILSQVSSTVLKNMSSAHANGKLQCRFQRSINTSESNIFPLNYNYYVFLGYGGVDPSTFTMQRHSLTPIISRNPINLTDSSSSSSSTSSPSASPAGVCNSARFHANGSLLRLELTGAATKQWVALGFSKDQKMGDDTVVSCSLANPQNTTIVAKFSYNDGHSNVAVNNPQNGITIVSSSFVDGVIKCTLLVQAFGLGNAKIFDLTSNTAYYLLLGAGIVDDNGVFQLHTETPSISSSKVNLTDPPNLSCGNTEEPSALLKAHGTLMITAWVLLVNPAILLARYFKTAWPNKKLLKTAVWFTIHRTLNILALLCTIAGFIIIFVDLGLPAPQTINDFYGENRSSYPGYYFAHAPLGIIVMILVIVNPVIAIFRCEPTHKNRFVFNWVHWSIGTVLQIVALVNVFFGIKMGETYPETDNRICHIAVFWILIAFVAFHIVIEMALFVHKFFDQGGCKAPSNKNEHEMQASGQKGQSSNHSKDNRDEKPTRASLIFRYICLAVYVTVVIGLWLAMIILIGSGKVN